MSQLPIASAYPNAIEIYPQNGTPPNPLTLADVRDPNLMDEIVQCANLSVEEMQQRGIASHIIQLVDRNRSQLKATLEEPDDFVSLTDIRQSLPQIDTAPDQHATNNRSQQSPIGARFNRPTPAQMQTAIELVTRLREENKSMSPRHTALSTYSLFEKIIYRPQTC